MKFDVFNEWETWETDDETSFEDYQMMFFDKIYTKEINKLNKEYIYVITNTDAEIDNILSEDDYIINKEYRNVDINRDVDIIKHNLTNMNEILYKLNNNLYSLFQPQKLSSDITNFDIDKSYANKSYIDILKYLSYTIVPKKED
tara:strand:+ start:110 stop:541 length:432 start_codon:yes stop_codon:yes gene_type:complete